MLTSLDKSGESSHRMYRSWGIGIYALPALLVLALFGLVMNHPDAADWISDAAQAEFAGANLVPDTAPTQLAQPAKQIPAVKAY